MAVDATYYEKLMTSGSFARLTDEREGWIGIAEDSKGIMPVFDLSFFLNMQSTNEYNQILIFNHMNKRYGLMIDKFLDFIVFDEMDYLHHPDISPFIIGTGKKGDVLMTLVKIHDILIEKYIEHYE